MTPADRITYWLKCRPLAEANQRMWIAAVLADGMRACVYQIQDAADYYAQTGHPEARDSMRAEASIMLSKSVEMEEAGKLPS